MVTKEAALKRWPKSDWPTGFVLVVASGIVTRPQARILEKLAADKSLPPDIDEDISVPRLFGLPC